MKKDIKKIGIASTNNNNNFKETFQLIEFDKFFSLSLELMCIADAEGYIKKVNKAWESLLGYSAIEVEDKKYLDFVHPKDIIKTTKAMLRLNNGDVVNFINRNICKDGSYKYFEWCSKQYGKLIYASARDITDKIKARDDLKEIADNFNTFFETIDDLIFVGTPEGKILYANNAVSEKLGYSINDLKGMHILDVHPEEHRKEAEKIFEAMFKGERNSCPIPLISKNKSYFPVETRVWFGKWCGQNCIFGISKDISKQQAALDKFYKFFDNNPALMAVSNIKDGKIVDVNSAFIETLGYSKSEIIGKTSNELNLFVNEQEHKKTSENLLEFGRINNVELDVQKKDGQILKGLFSGEIIDNQLEKSFLTVMIDITEIQLVKNQLERQIAFDEILLQQSTLLFCSEINDIDGIINDTLEKISKFVGVDRAYIFNYSNSMNLMSNTYEWCDKGIRSEKNNLQNLPTSTFPKWMETLNNLEEIYISDVSKLSDLWKAEKEILEMQNIKSLLAIPIISNKKLYGFMGFDSVKKIMEWKSESRLLLRFFADNLGAVWLRQEQNIEIKIASDKAKLLAKKAEAANKEKSEFLANISHEIRTPMNAVIGMTRLLLDTDLTDKQKKYSEIIKSSGESLLGIISNVLDISKIEAGMFEIENIKFSLEELFDKAIKLFELQAAEKGIELQVDIDSNIPMSLMGDPVRVTQVLNNLLSNAIKFSNGGNVFLMAKVIKNYGKSVDVEISVKDEGIGIPDNQIARLFNSFVQADASTTRKYGGTGLGLAICKKICELMGGSIKVKSLLGKGSIFLVYLKFDISREQNDLLLPEPEWKGIRVLVLDDNLKIRKRISAILSSWSFNVEAVSTGEKCIKKLKKAKEDGNPFSICLIDYRMPTFNGIEVAKKISDELVTLKLIMATSYDRPELNELTKEIGINALITKPIRPSTLFNEISLALGVRPIHITENFNNNIESLKNIRVLLVEDIEINREIAVLLLKNIGIEAAIAHDGKEAVEKIKNNDYDIVLMDIQMPVMDGFEATRQIRSLNKNGIENLPIIAMTAHALKDDRDKSISAGMNDHITKPIVPEELYSTLKRWVPLNSNKTKIDENAKNISNIKIDNDFNLNVEVGIKRMGGNGELYLKLLRKFVENYSDTKKKLLSELKKNQISEAVRRVHSLKAILASIGADELALIASHIENDLYKKNQGQNYLENKKLWEFLEKLYTLFETVEKSFFYKDKDCLCKKKPMGKANQLMKYLKDLKTPITNYEPKPSKQIILLIKSNNWGEKIDCKIEEINYSLSNYNFKEALKILDELIGKLESEVC